MNKKVSFKEMAQQTTYNVIMNEKFLAKFESPVELSDEQLNLFKFKVVKAKGTSNKQKIPKNQKKKTTEEEDKPE